MRTQADSLPALGSTMLTATIFLAQIDMHGLMDYALKAGIGGAIWLAYKIVADRIDAKRKGGNTTKQ